VRTEKRADKNVKIRLLFSETETAKQNQKFPFHFFFRFAVDGWGEETQENCKEIFWFLHTRVRERVRGALVRITTQSERTRQFRATTRSARAISRHQGCFQNTFELCTMNTAIFRKGFPNQKYGRREAPSVLHSPHKILILQGFATLRVAPRLPIQL
jgi:hypothetical protein